jgi:hypothetical protein
MNLRETLMAKRLNVMRARLVRSRLRQQLASPVGPGCNCYICQQVRASEGSALKALFRQLDDKPEDIEEPPGGGKAH